MGGEGVGRLVATKALITSAVRIRQTLSDKTELPSAWILRKQFMCWQKTFDARVFPIHNSKIKRFLYASPLGNTTVDSLFYPLVVKSPSFGSEFADAFERHLYIQPTTEGALIPPPPFPPP